MQCGSCYRAEIWEGGREKRRERREGRRKEGRKPWGHPGQEHSRLTEVGAQILGWKQTPSMNSTVAEVVRQMKGVGESKMQQGTRWIEGTIKATIPLPTDHALQLPGELLKNKPTNQTPRSPPWVSDLNFHWDGVWLAVNSFEISEDGPHVQIRLQLMDLEELWSQEC